MLINPDGSIIRDVDIDELRIYYCDDSAKEIVLTKNNITYQSIDMYNGIPFGCFDVEKVPLSFEQFLKLSDDIHTAGLLRLLDNASDTELYTDTAFRLSCIFDDGCQYEYMSTAPCEEIDNLVSILLNLREVLQAEKAICNEQKDETACKVSKCCNALLMNSWSFCPKCGKNLTELDVAKCEMLFDTEQTVWFCEFCEENIPFEYQYCGKCGKKRAW